MSDRQISPETEKIFELQYQKLKIEIETNQRLTTESLRHYEAMLSQTSDHFEQWLKQLDGVREAFREHVLTSLPREEADAKFESISKDATTKFDTLNAKIESSIDPIVDKINAIGRPNYTVLLSVLGFGATVLTGAWFIITMLIGNANGPITSTIDQLKIVQQSHEIRLRHVEDLSSKGIEVDINSKTDRAQLNSRLHELEVTVSKDETTQQSNASEVKQKVVEIETQLKNAGNVVNMLTDRTEEWLKIIYDKVFPGEHFSGTHFRPSFHKGDRGDN